MKSNKIITDIEQLTPEWLTRIFKNKGYLSQGEVVKIIKKKSQVTLSSNVHFLDINFSTNTQTRPASSSIFVKIPKPNATTQFLGKHEAKFYKIIAETMNEIPIPFCYDAAFSEETGLSHIILENLSETHINLPPVPPSKQYCEKAIDCLAELHAFWWNNDKLQDFSTYSFVMEIMKENPINEKLVFDYFKNQKILLKQFLLHSDKFFDNKISDNRKELFKTVFSLFPQLHYERINKKDITLIHTDAHFWNFLYPKDIDKETSRAILTDWATWGISAGCQDLSFMLGIFLSPDSRRSMEKDLTKRYYNALLKFGVENYSWDNFYYDYKLLTMLNLYRVLSWWFRGFPSERLWPYVESSICTIEDLNSVELLESKKLGETDK